MEGIRVGRGPSKGQTAFFADESVSVPGVEESDVVKVRGLIEEPVKRKSESDIDIEREKAKSGKALTYFDGALGKGNVNSSGVTDHPMISSGELGVTGQSKVHGVDVSVSNLGKVVQIENGIGCQVGVGVEGNLDVVKIGEGGESTKSGNNKIETETSPRPVSNLVR